MLTYEVTTRRDGYDKPQTRTVDCHYFTDDVNFVYFKNDDHKTVLAVPTDDVVSIELVQQHDGSGEKEQNTSDEVYLTLDGREPLPAHVPPNDHRPR